MERAEPMTDSVASPSGERAFHIEFLDRFSQANTNSFRASLLLSSLVVFGLWGYLPHSGLLAWLFTVWAVQTAHEVYSRYYRRHRGNGADEYRRWLQGFWLGAVLAGACWSLPFFLFDFVTYDAVLLLVFAIAGVTAYGGVARATVLSVALIFEFAAVLPLCVWLFRQDSHIHHIMGVAALLYLAMLMPLLRKMNQMVTRTLLLDGENHRLSDEQKRHLERLHSSEEEYRALAENLPVAVIRYDAEQRRCYINPAAEKMLHGTTMQMLGLVPGEGGVPATPAMIEYYRSKMTEVMASGETRDFEFVLDALPQGGQKQYEVRMAPEYGADGKTAGALAIWFDITERKRMEEDLRLKEHVLDQAHEGVYLVDEQARFVYVNDEACRALGYSRKELLGMGVQDIDHAYSVEAANAIAHTSREEGPFAFETQHRRRDGSLFPVEIQISASIYRGKHLGLAMARDISERKQAELALEGSNAMLRSVLQGIPDPVWMKDADGTFMVCNQGVARSLNKPIEQIIGKDDSDFFPSDRAALYQNKDRAVLEAGRVVVEEEWWTFGDNGEQALMETCKTPVRSLDGKVLGVLGVARDITERKAVQRQLEMLHRAINQTSDALFVQDDSLRFIAVNDAACRSLGYSREELTKMSTPDIDPGFTREKVVRAFVTAELGKPVCFESRHRAKDGRTIPVEITGTFFEIDGVRHAVAVARDITGRKQAETQLLERYERIAELNARLQENACTLEEQAVELEASKEQLMLTEAWYRGILQSAPDGMVVVDARGVIRLVNARLCHMFGYEDRELVGQTIELLVPLEMRDAHKTLRVGFIESGSPGRPMAGGRGGLRACRKDGSELFVDVSLARLPEMEGAMGTVCAAIRDVTEHKLMERRLAKREQEFRTLVENSVDTFARYGRDLRCQYVNPALAALAEAAPEWLGRTPSECPGGAHGAQVEKKLAQVFAKGKGLEFELEWPDRTGREMCSLISLTPEFDAQGEVISILSVGRDITELNAYRHKIHQMAFYDPLTALPNRALFNDRLRQMITDAAWHGQQAGLMMMDMDRFKEVNDTLGHAAGDELLRETAARLSACVRAYDTVARLGGDEFAILLPEVRSGDDLGSIASKILALFQQPFLLEGKEVFVSCSIGIALYPGDSTEADDLLKYADSAMYFAKRSGRNNFRFYSRGLTESAHERLVLESDLRRAIERDELELYYQPKVSLCDGALTGSEALLRWKHLERGMVPPDVFIGIAEDSGLIGEIGEWVLFEACHTARRWNGKGKPLHKVAINLSARQFQGGGLVETVCRALDESGCQPDWIELEITESLLLDEGSEVMEVLNSFRAMGISIAIDDFGTGYSALSYLARFPISTLKIDRSFICSLETDTYRAELVKAILSIARCLGQQVVAEGVETEAQVEFLRAHGCHAAQGYFYGRPMPVTDFERLSESFDRA